MREILFRGLGTIGKEIMVYGDLLHYGSYTSIRYDVGSDLEPKYIEVPVDPSSIGQYTGLKDKIGVKVFSGDIFRIDYKIYFVEYIDDQCRYVLTTGKGYDTPNCIDLTCDAIFNCCVVGNINQHKHLLE